MNIFTRIEAGIRAIRGGKKATRIYCGSYYLIRHRDSRKLYRCAGKTPLGYMSVIHDGNESVYDKDGFLLPKYWLLPRIIDMQPT